MALNDSVGERGATRFSSWTRASLSLQVALAMVLALVLAGLAIVVSEQPGLRLRVDTTQSRRNSLDPQTVEVLEALTADVRVELFFEPASGWLQGPMLEAQTRVEDLLRVMTGYAPDRIEVERYDMTGEGRGEATRRLFDLGARSAQKVIVSLGERQTILELIPDIATASPGDPQRGVPPNLVDFRGEEAVGEALSLMMTSGTPRVLFSTGHGEYSLEAVLNEEGQRALESVLQARVDLEGEGFSVGSWDPAVDGPVPADCDVLAIVGPGVPYTEEEAGWVQEHLDRGGRLLFAVRFASVDAEGRRDPLGELLAAYGINVARGFVNAPTRGLEGTVECARLQLDPQQLSSTHPITQTLRERERRLYVDLSRAFWPRGPAPFDGTLLDLAVSPEGSWRDLPSSRGTFNHIHDPSTEDRGVYSLGLAAEIEQSTSERPARLVALGSASMLNEVWYPYNRDFVRNTFNWLAEREVRIRVAARDPFESRIDLARGAELSRVTWFGMGVLPSVCLLLGILTFWLRRRED